VEVRIFSCGPNIVGDLMSLFETKDFTMHSGDKGSWKIDCDALSDEDLKTIAKLIADKIWFSDVYGIPKGGERLAESLKQYKKEGGCFLIVDDVVTTGRSMNEARKKFGILNTNGVAIFSRKKLDDNHWIRSVFTLW
jgi:hypothetical protein